MAVRAHSNAGSLNGHGGHSFIIFFRKPFDHDWVIKKIKLRNRLSAGVCVTQQDRAHPHIISWDVAAECCRAVRRNTTDTADAMRRLLVVVSVEKQLGVDLKLAEMLPGFIGMAVASTPLAAVADRDNGATVVTNPAVKPTAYPDSSNTDFDRQVSPNVVGSVTAPLTSEHDILFRSGHFIDFFAHKFINHLS
jgi:hypothetical protein